LVLVGEIEGRITDQGSADQIRVERLDWIDVWSWIRRNRPELTRYDQEILRTVPFDKLGDDLRLWAHLADELQSQQQGTELPNINLLVQNVIMANALTTDEAGAMFWANDTTRVVRTTFAITERAA
jgi:hypothetical protein